MESYCWRVSSYHPFTIDKCKINTTSPLDICFDTEIEADVFATQQLLDTNLLTLKLCEALPDFYAANIKKYQKDVEKYSKKLKYYTKNYPEFLV